MYAVFLSYFYMVKFEDGVNYGQKKIATTNFFSVIQLRSVSIDVVT